MGQKKVFRGDVGVGVVPSRAVFEIQSDSNDRLFIAEDTALTSTGFEIFGNSGNNSVSIKTSGGSNLEHMRFFEGGDVVVNEGGNDADFRVETSDSANALLVRSDTGQVGIRTASPGAELGVNGNIRTLGDHYVHWVVKELANGNSSDTIYIMVAKNSATEVSMNGRIYFSRSGSKSANGSGLMDINFNRGNAVGNQNFGVDTFAGSSYTYSHGTFVTCTWDDGNGADTWIAIQVAGGWSTDWQTCTFEGIENGVNFSVVGSALVSNVNALGNYSTKSIMHTSVGIGTTQPKSLLQIGSESSAWQIFNGWLMEGGTTGGTGISSNLYYSNAAYRFRTAGYNAAHVDVSGGMVRCRVSNGSGANDGDSAIMFENFSVKSAEVVVNDQSRDVDFRVESDTNTHALFVQGSDGNVGIGASSPKVRLEIEAVDSEPGLVIRGTNGGEDVIGKGAWIGLHNDAVATSTGYPKNGGIFYTANNGYVDADNIGNIYGTVKFSRTNSPSNNATQLEFGTHNGSVGHATRMTISPTGNVGIGNDGVYTSNDTGGTLDLSNIGGTTIGTEVRIGVNNTSNSTAVLRLHGYGSNSNTGGGAIYFDNDRFGTVTGAATDSNLAAIVCRRDGYASGYMRFYVGADHHTTAGHQEYLALSGENQEVIVNNSSHDVDFRVESNDNTHALFVDAGKSSVATGNSWSNQYSSFTANGQTTIQGATGSSTTETTYGTSSNPRYLYIDFDFNTTAATSWILEVQMHAYNGRSCDLLVSGYSTTSFTGFTDGTDWNRNTYTAMTRSLGFNGAGTLRLTLDAGSSNSFVYPVVRAKCTGYTIGGSNREAEIRFSHAS